MALFRCGGGSQGMVINTLTIVADYNKTDAKTWLPYTADVAGYYIGIAGNAQNNSNTYTMTTTGETVYESPLRGVSGYFYYKLYLFKLAVGDTITMSSTPNCLGKVWRIE